MGFPGAFYLCARRVLFLARWQLNFSPAGTSMVKFVLKTKRSLLYVD